MLNEDLPAAVMLEAEDLLRLWSEDNRCTLYWGVGTADALEVIVDRYPSPLGGIEQGVYLKPGTMAIYRKRTITDLRRELRA